MKKNLIEKDVIKRITAQILIVTMIAIQIPSGPWSMISEAALWDGDSALTASASNLWSLNLGAGVLASPSLAEPGDGWQGDHVYFGNYYAEATSSDASEATSSDAQKEPVDWRVLENKENGLLLFSDKILDQHLFGNPQTPFSNWDESAVKSWLNRDLLPELLSVWEQEAVVPATGGNAEPTAFGPETEENEERNRLNNPGRDGALFLLSAAEAVNPAYGFGDSGYPEDDVTRQLTATPYARSRGADLSLSGRNAWWLRSSQEGSSFNAGSVDIDGWLGADMASEVTVNGIAPACVLDHGQILLTSLAEGGKNKTAEPDSELLPVEPLDDSGEGGFQNWKLTVKDDRHKKFTVVESSAVTQKQGEEVFAMRAVPQDTVQIAYEGAVAGNDEHPEAISAILKSADRSVFYYGKLKAVSSGEDSRGTVSLTLPEDLEEGETYTVLLFEEQYNGDYKTDYASPFSTVQLEILRERSIEVTDGEILSIASASDATPSNAAPSKATSSNATPSDADSTGTAYEGFRVKIRANEAPEDMRFNMWRTTPINLVWKNREGAYGSKAEFVMPDMNVTLRSTYANLASSSDATVSQKVIPEDWMAYGEWDDLENMVSDEAVITEEDWEKLEKGWNFDIGFTMERKSDGSMNGDVPDDIRACMEEDETIGFFLVNSLKKHIVSRNLQTRRTEELDEVTLPVTVTLPLPDACRDMAGYRLIGTTPDDDEPREYDFFWQDGGKSRVLTFTAEANGIYALVYTPIDNVFRIQCPDITYGELVEPEVVNNPFEGSVSFQYKRRNGADERVFDEPPVNAGLYTVIATVEETEQYETMVISQDFEIRKKALEDNMLTVKYGHMEQGIPITPDVTVSDTSGLSGEELISQKDYTVRYEDNLHAGRAKAIVEARPQGNYKGRAVAEFAIFSRGSGSGGGGSRRFSDTVGDWIQRNPGEWRFYVEETQQWACNEWLRIKGFWYYFGPDELMKTGWLNLNGTWYYLKEEKNQLEGQMVTGWLLDSQDGNWYYLKPDGAMAVGPFWYKEKEYYLTEPDKAISGWKMDPQTGKWYFDQKESRPLGSWKE